MTLITGLRCSDAVVLGSDSQITFEGGSDGPGQLAVVTAAGAEVLDSADFLKRADAQVRQGNVSGLDPGAGGE